MNVPCMNILSSAKASRADHQGDRTPARQHACPQEGILADVPQHEGQR